MTCTHLFNSWERNPGGKKRCIVMRWGAIGDMLVAGSVCRWLDIDRGYHVTMHTNATGAEVLANNPWIDEFIVTDNEVTMQADFNSYLERVSERYDKVINLDHSLELLMLARPEQLQYHYPHEAREFLFDKNYLEIAHKIAGVVPEFYDAFYPTEEEMKWAAGGRKSLLPDPIVLWSIAGSSLNKIYPWVNLVAKWLVDKGVNVVFAGGAGPSRRLEEGIITTMNQDGADMTRVYPRIGAWSIRQSLTFGLHAADVVVGSETGLMHGVAFDPTPKVIYLSHSSEENLTKHWRNTTVLTPDTERCPCYPCHRIHESWDHCVVNEDTGVAQCASSIAPEAMFEAIMEAIGAKN